MGDVCVYALHGSDMDIRIIPVQSNALHPVHATHVTRLFAVSGSLPTGERGRASKTLMEACECMFV
jgi:hypothetical protein